MVKGFMKDNKFRPTGGQPIGRSSKEKTIDPDKGTLIKEGTFEFTPREKPVTWEVAMDRFIEFRKDIPDEEGFTFDPVTDTGYNFKVQDEALDFHNQFTEDENSSVFVIGVQNQLGRDPTRASQSAYEQVKNDDLDPLIGGFFSEELQLPFTDISFAVSGVNTDDAFDKAREYGQDFVTVVNKDGEFFIIETP